MLQFLQKPLAQLGLGLLILASIFFMGAKISNNIADKKIAVLLKEIDSLHNDILATKLLAEEAKGQLAQQKKVSDDLLTKVASLKEDNRKLQQKVDTMQPPLDVIAYTNNLPELQICVPLLAKQREDFLAREKTLKEEIASDRTLIDTQDKTIQSLKEERNKADEVIKSQNKTIELQDKLNSKWKETTTELNNRLQKEITVKKRWRITALGFGGALALVLLL